MEEDLGRKGAQVVRGGHRHPVGAGIEEDEGVAFSDFLDRPVAGEDIPGFADIADDIVRL
jgi:hypothetical protein